MVSRANLSIAGVNYVLSSRHPVDLGGLPASYDPFRGIASACPEALDIAIRIEVGSAPHGGSLTALFDTGAAWVMLRDCDHYQITLNARALRGEDLWTAQVARDVSRATVFCGEQMVRRTEHGIAIANPITYPLDQILLMHLLARHEGALVHAVGARIGGKALIFAGRSGAGKSTLARLLAGRRGLELLSDDRIVVRKVNSAFMAYGTPWPGDQGAALNDKATLYGICFLRHADADHIEPLTPSQALERLLPVTSVPWYDGEVVSGVLAFLDDLLARVPTFELHFKPSTGVADLVEELIHASPEQRREA
jgi:hypothetical protein